jgi:hypothetical protein
MKKRNRFTTNFHSVSRIGEADTEKTRRHEEMRISFLFFVSFVSSCLPFHSVAFFPLMLHVR